MSTAIDLTGQRFGKLVVLERDGQGGGGRARWRCKCDCGEVVSRVGRVLRSAESTSCGCVTGAKIIHHDDAWARRRAYRKELYWRRKRDKRLAWQMMTGKW